ncbi:hypothetical protein B7463_g4767, partial [Scytalidium lignicola]
MSRTSSEDEHSTFLEPYNNESKEYAPVFALDHENPNCNSRRARRRHLVAVVLLSAAFSILATLATQQISARLFHHNSQNSGSSLPDLNLPTLGDMMKTYEFEPIFVQHPSNETNQAWADLIPKGKGFVSLEKLEAAGEVPAIPPTSLSVPPPLRVLRRRGRQHGQRDAHDALLRVSAAEHHVCGGQLPGAVQGGL